MKKENINRMEMEVESRWKEYRLEEISSVQTCHKQRKNLADRMKDTSDPLRLVKVRDMWLTGFDVPCLHTMYIRTNGIL